MVESNIAQVSRGVSANLESISKLTLAPKSDSFRPTLQAENPEICPTRKYGIRNPV